MSKTKLVVYAGTLLLVIALPVFAAGQKNLPVLSSISPTSTTAGAAVTITATGSNFASGAIILWNGVSLTTTYVSKTTLTAPLTSIQVGTAGTDKVSVYAPGRFGGTSVALPFTVNPASTTTTTTSTTTTTTTTTSVAPIAITSTSVPAATAGTAYTAPLAVIGGTPPYTWSISTGALPPGLTLAPSTGAISGTPSAAGSVAFAAQVKDSSPTPQTQAYTYTLTVNPAPTTTTTTTTTTSAPTILFSDGFETGDFSNWSSNGAANYYSGYVASTTEQVHSGNFSYGQRYGYGASSSGGDANRWIAKILPGVNEVWTRGWVFIKSPEADAAPLASTIYQRKLIEWGDSTGGSDCCGNWTPILDSWNDLGGVATTDNRLEFVTAPCGNPQVAHYNIGTFAFDSWHELEVHLALDTGNTANGVVDVWLDGVNTFHSTTEILRGTCTTQITGYFFGRQADSPPNAVIDEYRYWDDIAIGTGGYIP